jgi:hypothetical protein
LPCCPYATTASSSCQEKTPGEILFVLPVNTDNYEFCILNSESINTPFAAPGFRPFISSAFIFR